MGGIPVETPNAFLELEVMDGSSDGWRGVMEVLWNLKHLLRRMELRSTSPVETPNAFLGLQVMDRSFVGWRSVIETLWNPQEGFGGVEEVKGHQP